MTAFTGGLGKQHSYVVIPSGVNFAPDRCQTDIKVHSRPSIIDRADDGPISVGPI